ncbi:hypothetical protein DFR86_11035 [Acidianus sulfidivorans JP7]|uniref:Uncharacterized protein n=1 Tax=Acidianus sulfidivorans JP7 TaxID=619593 RepID=A0A2U9IQL4_9CREN|nr:hypothetical protein [Acidianus sulfidivorans]AWR98348.1 hypothetical protein DFR86_11035 [Acidianus sulfidivorans JP7]
MIKRKLIHPLFYYLLFVDFTVLLPIIINGIRVLNLWYSPLSDTGQITFLKPFILFSVVSFLISVILGILFYKKKSNRFILVSGPMRLRNVVKAMIKDSFGRMLIAIYSILYFISFLITSGLLIIPGINVDSYFTQLTAITYEGSGINILKIGPIYFAQNTTFLFLGVIVDVVLTLSLILSYYVVSLVYVSLNIYSFPVPKKFRIYGLSTAGGFLTASVPSIGTIAGICCLTPTAINSLLYLASGILPFAKGITWKYGVFILGAWTGGILQMLSLASPMILGLILIGVSTYYIYSISNKLSRMVSINE